MSITSLVDRTAASSAELLVFYLTGAAGIAIRPVAFKSMATS
jgi:hypothetical protein